ncbi:MAG TPA: hypothetical protein VM327_00680 [Candidatus Thermoplasmatota archaeon]|nr:hypothetical protein [Candidatus Thermoplasmatota archaeon]
MARRPVDAVSLKRTEPNGYEFEIGRFGYRLHFDEETWFLDQFERQVSLEFVGSFQFASLSESINFALQE